MKSRLAASIALGAVVVLGATGCNMIASQATTIEYSASDGINVPESGPIKVRNAMIIADDEGAQGNLIAALVNDTDERTTLTVGINGQTQSIPVDARSAVSLGVDTAPMLFGDFGGKPGDNVLVSFQSGEGSGAEISIPVLDGTLPYYEEFVPSAE